MTDPTNWRAIPDRHDHQAAHEQRPPDGSSGHPTPPGHPAPASHAPRVAAAQANRPDDGDTAPVVSASAPALAHELSQNGHADPGNTRPSLPAPRLVPVFTPPPPAMILPGRPANSGPLDNPAHGVPTAPAPGDSIWRSRKTRPGAKILIVENEYTNQLLMERILGFAGYECVTAGNGHIALDVFDREHPDLVLTDIAMPVMDGLAAVAALRARPAGARIPIVAVSAHALPEDREYALRRGCTDYLTKPYRPHDLLEVVERLLREGRG